MALHRAQNPRGSLPELPADVEVLEVTVTVEGGRHPVRDRLANIRFAARRRVIVGLAVAVGGGAAMVGGALHAKGVPGRNPAAQPRASGPAGVAAAYRYPLGCLSVSIAVSDPAYARARLDRASPCWRYGAYVTAVFHRVDGAWRVVLNAARYSCPLVSLPVVVQAQLALCPEDGRRSAAPGRSGGRALTSPPGVRTTVG